MFLLDSLQTIQSTLERAAPEITTCYVEHVPANGEAPAFYLEHLASGVEALGTRTKQFTIQWRIMYLSPSSPDGTPDYMNQLTVCDRVMHAFLETATVASPGGIRYEISELAGGSDATGMFLTVKLQTQQLRTSAGENDEVMQAVRLDSNFSS